MRSRGQSFFSVPGRDDRSAAGDAHCKRCHAAAPVAPNGSRHCEPGRIEHDWRCQACGTEWTTVQTPLWPPIVFGPNASQPGLTTRTCLPQSAKRMGATRYKSGCTIRQNQRVGHGAKRQRIRSKLHLCGLERLLLSFPSRKHASKSKYEWTTWQVERGIETNWFGDERQGVVRSGRCIYSTLPSKIGNIKK